MSLPEPPALALAAPAPGADAFDAERAALGGAVRVEALAGDPEVWWRATRALARLQHPAIPPLLEVGRLDDGRIARVRARVTGARWETFAAAQGERARADALLRAAEALDHAHARSVAHGAFGPDALVLGERGQVWVVGWGARDGADEDDVRPLIALIDATLGPDALDADARGAPGEPPPTAAGVARRLRAWQDGADRRARAQDAVARAEALLAGAAEASAAHAAAARLARAEATRIPTWASEAERHAVWAHEDAAEAHRRASVDGVEAARQALHAALEQDPGSAAAHAALARSYAESVAAAEREGLAAAAARASLALHEHVRRLPPAHPLRARDDRFLRGTAALTLVTDPPGARVFVERYEERAHRLVLRPVGELGRTPLVAVDLAPGSYRLRVEAPGHAPLLYPVHVERHAHWDGVPPGASAPFPVPLLRADALGPDERYVPAGWFAAGQRDGNVAVPPRRLWCDGFVVARFPVTAGELLAGLDALLDAGDEETALAIAPRANGALRYPLGPDGRFRSMLSPDAAALPAAQVSFEGARRWASWRRAAEGRPWRLLMDLEWEKAARGVDGRLFPWGRRRATRWANLALPDRPPALAPVHAYPLDESPYGVRGVAGNVSDWVADVFEPRGPALPDGRVVVLDPTPPHPPEAAGVTRGGTFGDGMQDPTVASRAQAIHARVRTSAGFRLARSV